MREGSLPEVFAVRLGIEQLVPPPLRNSDWRSAHVQFRKKNVHVEIGGGCKWGRLFKKLVHETL